MLSTELQSDGGCTHAIDDPPQIRRLEKQPMNVEKLTLEGIRARPVIVKLNRPITNRIAITESWPLILIDLYTSQGVTGRSYLEPYVPKAMRYLIPALNDMAELLKGHTVAPFDLFDATRKSLRAVGYQGMSMIAVSGLDMAAWDALAKAANLPLCVFLGGTVGPVKAYSINGLWLNEPMAVAEEALELLGEGSFAALKLRLGREKADKDLATLAAVKNAVGSGIQLMIDYSQELDMAEALYRCQMIDDLGLAWIEEPIAYDNLDGYSKLTAELRTPVQMGENLYGPREVHNAIRRQACNFIMPDFMRIGGVTGWMRSAAIAGAAGIPISTHLYPEAAAHVMRVAESAHWLEWQDWATPILQEPYAVRNGALEVPDKPGLGLDWDEGFVTTHIADL